MQVLLFDLARVLLFPKDQSYAGNLNSLHRKFSINPKYDPLEHFVFNVELLTYLEKIKNKLDLYVFTSETMQEHPAFSPFLKVFKDVFSASQLGITKNKPESYRNISNQIGENPEDIIFIDDNKKNVEAAVTAGLIGIVYKSNVQLLDKLNILISYD